MQTDEFVKQHAGPFLERLKQMGQYGIPNIGKAPYYIIVAEQRGIPAVEQLSLAHCLQNMWLKAAALGIGFQLLSITETLDKDKEFCDLIKIPEGEFALDGCQRLPRHGPNATKETLSKPNYSMDHLISRFKTKESNAGEIFTCIRIKSSGSTT